MERSIKDQREEAWDRQEDCVGAFVWKGVRVERGFVLVSLVTVSDKCVACLPAFLHLQQLLEIQKSNMKFKSNIGSLRDAHECKEDHLPSPQDLQNMLQLLDSQVWHG